MNKVDINKLELKDKTLICVDCGEEFIFSVGEQRYFISKGLSIPKRCSECRLSRRQHIVPEGSGQ